jgi:CRISPR/Cas system-associated exonuclease Cas4 (RecB family)
MKKKNEGGKSEPKKQPLSRSKLELFNDCPRCFYADLKLGVKRPPSFPMTLNNAVDALFKKEFDRHREFKTVHPLLKDSGVDAIPFQHPEFEDWRKRNRGVRFLHEKSGFEVYGLVDDVWQDRRTKELIVADYKATSKSTEVNLDAEWQNSYKRQVEVYQWLLRQRGFKVSDKSYFVYTNARQDLPEFGDTLRFVTKLVPYVGNTGWIEVTLQNATKLLKQANPPLATPTCKFCEFVSQSSKFTLEA